MKCRAASGCERQHADHMVCCSFHWFKVPKGLRDQIWHLYRSAPSSDAHREAVFAALESL